MPKPSAPLVPPSGSVLSGARLRALRLAAGRTLDALARESGLDKSYLSRLERGLKAPSVATVLKLSVALHIPVSQLLGEELSQDAVRIGRAAQRRRTGGPGEAAPGGKAGFEMLTQSGGMLEAFIVHLGGARDYESYVDHDGEELLLVLTGTVELRFADRGFVLEPGDCALFPGHLPHRVRQIGRRAASAMIAVAREREAMRPAQPTRPPAKRIPVLPTAPQRTPKRRTKDQPAPSAAKIPARPSR